LGALGPFRTHNQPTADKEHQDDAKNELRNRPTSLFVALLPALFAARLAAQRATSLPSGTGFMIALDFSETAINPLIEGSVSAAQLP
jgi:hypothetical protein